MARPPLVKSQVWALMIRGRRAAWIEYQVCTALVRLRWLGRSILCGEETRHMVARCRRARGVLPL